MKKSIYCGLLLCLALLACTLVLTACDNLTQPPAQSTETTAQPSETQTEQTEQIVHQHAFGEWVITKEPTCTENGLREQSCDCGEKQTEAMDPLPHTEVRVAGAPPTCTQTGLSESAYCSVCAQTTLEQIVLEALGHTETEEGYHPPSCTQDGWMNGTVCSVCKVRIKPRDIIPATGHEYSHTVTVIDPTCEKSGYTLNRCHCGANIRTDETQPLGHEFGEWYTYYTPTCTTPGLNHRDCERCDHIDKQEIPSPGHSYSPTVYPPSCTQQGYSLYACRNCSDTYVGDYRDALGHTYSTVVTQPGCLTVGYTTHTCYCGHTYKDAYIEPLGHSYSAKTTQPTCTSQGYTTYTCHCGISYTTDYTSVLEHQLGDAYYDIFPTCTAPGLERKYCVSCSYYEERYVAPLGHDLKETVVEPTCTEQGFTAYSCLCGYYYNERYTPALGHAYVVTVVPATCTEQGYTAHTCRCGTTIYEDYTPVLKHQYESVVTPPTCIDKGYTTHTCKNCEYSFVDTYTNVVLHDYQRTVIASTCTEGGYSIFTCKYCNKSYVDFYTNPQGHNFWIWETNVAATCTQDGVESRYCMRCKLTETRSIEATGHNYTTKVTQPTCQEMGYTTYTCQNCDDAYDTAFTEIVDHKFGDWIVQIKPTCTKDGVEARNCWFCGLYEENVVPATGHTYQEIVTAPTCHSYGSLEYKCACGSHYLDSYIDPLPHTFGEWYRSLEPTCTRTGLDLRDCTVCGHKDERTVPEIDHTYTATVVAPTCKERGYTKHACRCGDYYYDNYTEITDHAYSDWEIVYDATCTEPGLRYCSCVTCGFTITEMIEFAHRYTTAVTPPTCTEDGYTTYTCSKCGDTYQNAYTEPTGHSEIEIPAVEPTYTAGGWTAGTKCGICGTILTAPQQLGRYIKITLVYDSAAMSATCTDKLGTGARATVTASVNKGYIFEGWYQNDTLVSTSAEYLFVLGEEDVVLTAKVSKANIWDGSIASSFAGGSGTKEDPYLIANGAQLAYLAQLINSSSASSYNTKYYAMTADIDLGGINWDPIGCIYSSSGSADTQRAFKGHFDGRGYTIYNLAIFYSKYNFYRFFGLFGVLEAGGYVENVNVINCNVEIDGDVSGLACCGGIAGRGVSATVKNCTVTGKVSASTSASGVRVGGIIGMTLSGTAISDCHSEVTASGFSSDNNAMVGGIAGNIEGTTVARCSTNSTVSVSGTGNVYVVAGGVVGYAQKSSSIYDCYSYGSVSGSNRRVEARIGGVVGAVAGATVTRCYSTCSVFAQSEKNAIAGGIVGHLLSSDYSNNVYGCLSLASVSADNFGGWYTYTGMIYGYKSSGSLSNNHSSKSNSISFYTDTLGWSADVWDFSGELPTLKR